MYGKIFDSIYDGTLHGHWEAIVTMQQLIVLADADGMVDMTPQAIAARTSIPLDIITTGLKLLGEPDPYSRTPGEEGRRIELIDGHRPWGWHLVNHEKYRHLQDADTVRAQNRERAQRHRDRNKAPELVTVRNGASRDVTPSNAESRHTDTDTDTKNKATSPPDGGPIWTESLSILIAEGNSEKAARGFLGLLCREYDEAEVVNAVKAAVGKVNATAYIRGVLKDRPKKGKTEKRMVM